MAKWIKVLALLIIFTVVLTYTTMAYTIPDTIRIGLFYRTSAKDSVEVKADGGLAVGYETGDGKSVCVFEDANMQGITVSKFNDSVILLGQRFESYDEAWAKAYALKAETGFGFPAIVAGAFRVVSGMGKEPQAGEETHLAAGKAVCLQYEGKPVFLFDSQDSYLTLWPKSDTISINGTKYRGGAQFKRMDDSDMTVINVVGMDDYLKGVLPKEVTPSWNMEALKAQAVVARTYAVTQMDKFKKYGFNLDDTTASQVYKGASVQHERTDLAVMETSGQIVLYNDKPAQVFFFATSGGMTENVKNVWGSEYSYLTSVTDIYENPKEASYYTWEVTLSPEKVKEILKNKGVDIGDILSITPLSYSGAGRVLKLEITGTAGSKVYEKEGARLVFGLNSQAFSVRREGTAFTSAKPFGVLGADNEIKPFLVNNSKILSASGIYGIKEGSVSAGGNGSADMQVTKTEGGGNFIFEGRGWGHGIGMSQWGAKGMGDNGFGYADIIKHYFKGAQVG